LLLFEGPQSSRSSRFGVQCGLECLLLALVLHAVVMLLLPNEPLPPLLGPT
jgi:hypothetical protein